MSPGLCRRAMAFAGIAGLVLGSGYVAGLRVNATPSMPRGLWQVRPYTPIMRGAVVTVCPPDTASIREGAARGYLPAGNCADGHEPLIKPVAAVAGDLVTVLPTGIAVNGNSIAGSVQLVEDSKGRPLHPIPRGEYRVASGEVWLLATYDPRSFDSRYFGPLPLTSVQGVARPVWVLR